MGADTNNSNLKNNYEEVKLWSYREERFVKTGLQFCGLIMGLTKLVDVKDLNGDYPKAYQNNFQISVGYKF